jgi:hypothetical protein
VDTDAQPFGVLAGGRHPPWISRAHRRQVVIDTVAALVRD